LRNYVTVNPVVSIRGIVKTGNRSMAGTGAIIKDQVNIGENTLIGAGCVVVKDIPANSVAFGNPCKVIKENV
jgi:acetyltransferase-like isoleucine patch superfamily enzyme